MLITLLSQRHASPRHVSLGGAFHTFNKLYTSKTSPRVPPSRVAELCTYMRWCGQIWVDTEPNDELPLAMTKLRSIRFYLLWWCNGRVGFSMVNGEKLSMTILGDNLSPIVSIHGEGRESGARTSSQAFLSNYAWLHL